jgi:hypothetical protein
MLVTKPSHPGAAAEVRSLGGAAGHDVPVLLASTMPEQTSADTGATTAASHLTPGTTYTLQAWEGAWRTVDEFTAEADTARTARLWNGVLYWLVEKGGRKLERPFTIEGGRQRFW